MNILVIIVMWCCHKFWYVTMSIKYWYISLSNDSQYYMKKHNYCFIHSIGNNINKNYQYYFSFDTENSMTYCHRSYSFRSVSNSNIFLFESIEPNDKAIFIRISK